MGVLKKSVTEIGEEFFVSRSEVVATGGMEFCFVLFIVFWLIWFLPWLLLSLLFPLVAARERCEPAERLVAASPLFLFPFEAAKSAEG